MAENADELAKALELVRRSAGSIRYIDEGRGLVDVISRYPRTFLWLQQYDEGFSRHSLHRFDQFYTNSQRFRVEDITLHRENCYEKIIY